FAIRHYPPRCQARQRTSSHSSSVRKVSPAYSATSPVVFGRGFFFGVLILLPNGFEVHGRRGQLDLEPFQVVHDNPGHREVAKPLAVGGDDEPGCPLGATTG